MYIKSCHYYATLGQVCVMHINCLIILNFEIQDKLLNFDEGYTIYF